MSSNRNYGGNDYRKQNNRNAQNRDEYRRHDQNNQPDRRRERRALDSDDRQNSERIYGSSQTALRGGNYDRPARNAGYDTRDTRRAPHRAGQTGQSASFDAQRSPSETERNSRTDYTVPPRGNTAGGTDYQNNSRERYRTNAGINRAGEEDGKAQSTHEQSREYYRIRRHHTSRKEFDRQVNPGRRIDNPRRVHDAERFASNTSNALENNTPNIANKVSSAFSSMRRGASEAIHSPRSVGDTVTDWAKNASENVKKQASQEKEELKREAKAAATSGANELNLSDKKRQDLAYWHNIATKAFGGILTFGLVLGLLFFLRPSVSQAENRELTKFPSFSVSDFINGAWTEGVSTWYADTYPFRDQLMAVNNMMKGLYGFESETQMYGTTAQADEIPDEAKKQTKKKDPVSPETYDSWNLEADIQGQIMEGLYVENGTVYATYGFTQEAADDYINAVNGAAEKLDGTTQVYSILIPNNSGVLLKKDELAALGGSNQGQAIQYYYDSYTDKVKTIPTMKPLVDHNDEYIYFRTDHHWTALGAYYVYQVFCEEKGMKSNDITTFEEKDFAPFLGSYYAQLQLESLAANPDTVQAWIPKGTNDMQYTDVYGSVIDWNVIKDVSEWDQGTQYNCFVAGDQPWAEIHNPNITDGSSCLVVKESYGNAFVPWLVDHYQNVYIVDFRYYNGNVVDICKEKKVDDLILLNNISIIGSVDVSGKIASIL